MKVVPIEFCSLPWGELPHTPSTGLDNAAKRGTLDSTSAQSSCLVTSNIPKRAFVNRQLALQSFETYSENGNNLLLQLREVN